MSTFCYKLKLNTLKRLNVLIGSFLWLWSLAALVEYPRWTAQWSGYLWRLSEHMLKFHLNFDTFTAFCECKCIWFQKGTESGSSLTVGTIKITKLKIWNHKKYEFGLRPHCKFVSLNTISHSPRKQLYTKHQTYWMDLLV